MFLAIETHLLINFQSNKYVARWEYVLIKYNFKSLKVIFFN